MIRMIPVILNNLAGLLKAEGKYAEAEPLYRRALGIDEKALGSEHPYTALDLSNLALLLDAKGDYAGAVPLLRRALAIYEKALGANARSTERVRIALQDVEGRLRGRP